MAIVPASAATNGVPDPCGSSCVPDCYCCGTPLATAIGFDPPSTLLLSVSQTPNGTPLDGVLVVPHPPPIA
jgi:hypothetical protein